MGTVMQQVEDFARSAHGSQRRKFADEPYIRHPLRVMELCREYDHDPAVLAAALLHDVLEDTDTGRDAMLQFLVQTMTDNDAGRTLKFVEELTDIFTKKNYPHLNRRQRKNREAQRLKKCSAVAQTIKYADIIDNSLDIINAEPDFAKRYLLECRHLLQVMQAGNPALRMRAFATVEQCMERQKQL